MGQNSVRIAVVGAGQIGRKHLSVMDTLPSLQLAAISDPMPEAEASAKSRGAPFYTDFEKMLDAAKPEGVVIATPNQLHAQVALACIARKIPVLIEKPVTDTIEAGLALVAAAKKAGVPTLVGHHRRYNPVIRMAAEIVREGRLGRLTAVNATWLQRKPDSYYEIAWRREPGGGTVLINAIHDIDCMRMICGEIESVTALAGNGARNMAVEDTAGAILQFANGAIGTLLVSDAVPSARNWEASSRENDYVPHEPETCYFIAGTKASLSVPSLEMVWDEKRGGWGEPLTHQRAKIPPEDAYVNQLMHFARVIRDGEKPVIDAEEGTRTLATTLAVTRSAASGKTIRIADLLKAG